MKTDEGRRPLPLHSGADHGHAHPHEHDHDHGHDDHSSLPRRAFLQLVGAAGLAACYPPRGEIYPYSRQPREVIPGKPQVYATSLVDRGYAVGVLATSWSGRPIKLDGNPDHPATPRGGSNVRLQAAIMGLYEPTRATHMLHGGQAAGWSRFLKWVGEGDPSGDGLHFLLPPVSSPLTISLIERIREAKPGAAFHFHDPAAAPDVLASAAVIYGEPLLPLLHLEKAQVIASFDADFLMEHPFSIRYATDFGKNREVRANTDGMSRLYVVEGDLTVTGAIADHRLRSRPSLIPSMLVELLGEIARSRGRLAPGPRGYWSEALGPLESLPPASPWIRALAGDLLARQGAGVVIVGPRQPKEAHIVGHAINAILGNVGTTVTFSPPVLYEEGTPSHGLAPLVAALRSGQVSRLVALEVDPVYDAPVDLAFSDALQLAREVACSDLHVNGIARTKSTWFLDSLHFLERWGDARAYDGTLSLIQPLIRPLHGGRSMDQILAAFAGDPAPDDRALLRARYAALPEPAWEAALQHGFFSGAAAPEAPNADPAVVGVAVDSIRKAPPLPALELSLRPDPKLGAGQDGANEWLIELPEPITRLGWGNAALMSPATLQKQGLERAQMIEVAVEGRSIRIPALPVEGMADDLVSITLGWGNLTHPSNVEYTFRSEEVIVGVDAYPLRTTRAPWIAGGVTLTQVTRRPFPYAAPEVEKDELAVTQTNLEMHDRPILLGATLEAFRSNPEFVKPHDEARPDLYGTPWAYSGQQWGMAVDLTTCIGCQACVVACIAENNIPVVGKVNTNKGRIMHWLRIDRYRLGDGDDDVRLMPQPMMCQHCEKAPCEYVCPVNATVHSPDGLNEQVYNRCIGTRFCSNNCPYKVRRFNFLLYNDTHMPETLQMSKNPNVTVRGRGVMEKCTYCVQRIRTAEIEARIEQRHIREGEVRTACQVACPTNAIVFGLLSDPASDVSRLHRLSRTYGVLQHELATEPRTRYLANLHNPNPELKG